MDRTELANRALMLLGELEYTGGTPHQALCDAFIKPALLELLAQYDWSFARKRKALVDVGEGWRLPDDCLRIVELHGLRNWRKYGRLIQAEGGRLTTAPYVEAVYTSNEMALTGELPDDVQPEFTQAVVLVLASKLAVPVRNDAGLMVQLDREARMWLERAAAHDIQQDNSNDQDPLGRVLGMQVIR